MEGYLAQIIMFGGNFAPRNWAFCHGQLLAISSNSALFSLLGTAYGGDGRTTFGLPDLRGRVPIGQGAGPGLPNNILGQKGGSPTTTLTVANLPPHNHAATLHAESDVGSSGAPTNALLGVVTGATKIYAPSVPADQVAMHPDSITVGNTGGGTSFSNEQPYQVLHYVICTQGIYPSRN
ncbi:phage tail protein [Erythrobacter sp. JK5]|uniref:phage tail protein n=1 Tax=Erythrobacter sp. JK5 TaxID=2829500 RepID=UPI001BA8B5CF|nr:tail fiber protein [Erythrobacter sp. JK5]QUL37814.1 phage tail protein [Erythrobacter sp. JK5]